MAHIPRKRFGQHFLSDQSIIHRIIAVLDPKPQDHLVEIGPGQGALTTYVLNRAQRLDVVELDRDLIPALQERCRHARGLVVHHADALEFDFSEVKQDDRLLRLFGNLPYNISTPLIFHLLSFASLVSDMTFMLQKEVAERLAASISTADYGRLSVMVQYYCQVDLLFDVPPSAFYPPPQVMSSIVRLTPYHTLPHIAQDFAFFEKLVKQAFGQRRKTLRNSLKSLISDDMWEQAALDPHLRPENLTVSDFVALSNCASARSCPPTP